MVNCFLIKVPRQTNEERIILKHEFTPLPHTINKTEFKMNHRPKCKCKTYKTLNRKDGSKSL